MTIPGGGGGGGAQGCATYNRILYRLYAEYRGIACMYVMKRDLYAAPFAVFAIRCPHTDPHN